MPAEPYAGFLCQADRARRLSPSSGLYVGFASLLLTAELLVFAENVGIALVSILLTAERWRCRRVQVRSFARALPEPRGWGVTGKKGDFFVLKGKNTSLR